MVYYMVYITLFIVHGSGYELVEHREHPLMTSCCPGLPRTYISHPFSTFKPEMNQTGR